MRQSSTKPELSKTVKGLQSDLKTLQVLTNASAREFYLTFYNPKKDLDLNIEQLYLNFTLFFEAQTACAVGSDKSN